MATRRYSIQPGDRKQDIVEAVGAAIVTKMFEFTVDLTALAAVPGLTAGQGKEQVIIGLDYIADYITESAWPPA